MKIKTLNYKNIKAVVVYCKHSDMYYAIGTVPAYWPFNGKGYTLEECEEEWEYRTKRYLQALNEQIGYPFIR